MIKKYNIHDIKLLFDCSDINLFEPQPLSFMIANSLKISRNDIVLDLCSGSGIFAITAKLLGADKCLASDISLTALRNASKNISLNGLSNKITLIASNMCLSFKANTFTKIITNPPCMPFPPNGYYISAEFRITIDGGYHGSNYYNDVITCAQDLLKIGGELIIPVPRWSNWKSIEEKLFKHFDCSIISSDTVNFYLANDNPILKSHIVELAENNIVDIRYKGDKIYSEVIIYKAVKK